MIKDLVLIRSGLRWGVFAGIETEESDWTLLVDKPDATCAGPSTPHCGEISLSSMCIRLSIKIFLLPDATTLPFIISIGRL